MLPAVAWGLIQHPLGPVGVLLDTAIHGTIVWRQQMAPRSVYRRDATWCHPKESRLSPSTKGDFNSLGWGRTHG